MAKKTGAPNDPFDDEWSGPGESTVTSDEMPEPSSDGRRNWLKPHHLGKALKGTLELVRVEGASEYSDVTLVVKFGDSLFNLGLQLFSEDYKRLRSRFGSKRSDWHGNLRYMVMPHKGNALGYIAVR